MRAGVLQDVFEKVRLKRKKVKDRGGQVGDGCSKSLLQVSISVFGWGDQRGRAAAM